MVKVSSILSTVKMEETLTIDELENPPTVHVPNPDLLDHEDSADHSKFDPSTIEPSESSESNSSHSDPFSELDQIEIPDNLSPVKRSVKEMIKSSQITYEQVPITDEEHADRSLEPNTPLDMASRSTLITAAYYRKKQQESQAIIKRKENLLAIELAHIRELEKDLESSQLAISVLSHSASVTPTTAPEMSTKTNVSKLWTQLRVSKQENTELKKTLAYVRAQLAARRLDPEDFGFSVNADGNVNADVLEHSALITHQLIPVTPKMHLVSTTADAEAQAEAEAETESDVVDDIIVVNQHDISVNQPHRGLDEEAVMSLLSLAAQLEVLTLTDGPEQTAEQLRTWAAEMRTTVKAAAADTATPRPLVSPPRSGIPLGEAVPVHGAASGLFAATTGRVLSSDQVDESRAVDEELVHPTLLEDLVEITGVIRDLQVSSDTTGLHDSHPQPRTVSDAVGLLRGELGDAKQRVLRASIASAGRIDELEADLLHMQTELTSQRSRFEPLIEATAELERTARVEHEAQEERIANAEAAIADRQQVYDSILRGIVCSIPVPRELDMDGPGARGSPSVTGRVNEVDIDELLLGCWRQIHPDASPPRLVLPERVVDLGDGVTLSSEQEEMRMKLAKAVGMAVRVYTALLSKHTRVDTLQQRAERAEAEAASEASHLHELATRLSSYAAQRGLELMPASGNALAEIAAATERGELAPHEVASKLLEVIESVPSSASGHLHAPGTGASGTAGAGAHGNGFSSPVTVSAALDPTLSGPPDTPTWSRALGMADTGTGAGASGLPPTAPTHGHGHALSGSGVGGVGAHGVSSEVYEQMADAQAELDHAARELIITRERLTTTVDELRAAKKTLAAKQGELENTGKRLSSSESEVTDLLRARDAAHADATKLRGRIDSLTRDNSALSASLSQAEHDRDVQVAGRADMAGRAADLELELSRLQGLLEARGEAADAAETRLAELRREAEVSNEGLRSSIAETRRTLDAVRQELEDVKERGFGLSRELEESTRRCRELVASSKALEKELGRCKAAHSDVSTALQESKGQNEELGSRNARLAALARGMQGELKQLRDSGEKLEQHLEHNEGARRALELQLEEASAELAKLRQVAVERDTAEADAERLQEAVTASGSRVLDLEQELSHARSALVGLSDAADRANTAESLVERMSGELSAFRARVEELTEALGVARRARAQSEESLHQEREHSSVLRDEIGESGALLREAQEAVHRWQKQTEQSELLEAALRVEIDSLKTSLEETTHALEARRSTMGQLVEQLDTARAELESIRGDAEDCARMRKEHAAASEGLETLRARVEELETDCTAQLNEITALRERESQAASRANAAESDLNDVSLARARLGEEVTGIRRQLIDVQGALREAQSSQEQANADARESRGRLEATRARLSGVTELEAQLARVARDKSRLEAKCASLSARQDAQDEELSRLRHSTKASADQNMKMRSRLSERESSLSQLLEASGAGTDLSEVSHMLPRMVAALKATRTGANRVLAAESTAAGLRDQLRISSERYEGLRREHSELLSRFRGEQARARQMVSMVDSINRGMTLEPELDAASLYAVDGGRTTTTNLDAPMLGAAAAAAASNIPGYRPRVTSSQYGAALGMGGSHLGMGHSHVGRTSTYRSHLSPPTYQSTLRLDNTTHLVPQSVFISPGAPSVLHPPGGYKRAGSGM
eukprot:gnl/Dysnectes_brevis/4210_a5564_439.p1 GENE.gnl/Dysnectes_brevis/4210_a5564_439~~gnl/Dysnectes_brevis/4210_a5564_439.p1  ORF type:complete len:1694 (+),score=433.18 gnl/Dysnectes_brevis/4210_a5564_439:1-5082(+)